MTGVQTCALPICRLGLENAKEGALIGALDLKFAQAVVDLDGVLGRLLVLGMAVLLLLYLAPMVTR